MEFPTSFSPPLQVVYAAVSRHPMALRYVGAPTRRWPRRVAFVHVEEPRAMGKHGSIY